MSIASVTTIGFNALNNPTVSDFEYEFQMALTNKKMLPYAETVFLSASANNMYLSSSLVKQVAMFNGDISDFIPRPILAEVQARLHGVNGVVPAPSQEKEEITI